MATASASQLAQAALIALGAVAIGAAMYRTRALMEVVATERRAGWQVLRGMMGCFMVGYLGAVWLILTDPENVLGWLVGVVFLGGAGFVYVVVDMSVGALEQLARTSTSREAYQITLDTVVDAIVTIDPEGAILFANSGTSKLFGYHADELLGQNVKMLMPPRDATEHDGYIRRYLDTGEARVIGVGREVVGRRKDGSTFPLDLSINEMVVGGQRQFVGSLRDITERKEVDLMKGEFISVVSHELRTPLTSIRGSLGLLLGGVSGELSPKARSLVDIGVRSCDRLVRLINDILDVEKIESGAIEMRRREVPLDGLLATAVQSNRAFGDQHGVRIESVGVSDVLVRVDEDRIVQVLTNLLSNAIKFSPEGGVVRLTAGRVGALVRVEVWDDGPGIPKEFLPRVFDKFAQADSSSTRKISGSGLGLSISRAIVEQHGGAIGFDVGDDSGTTFFFELEAMEANREL